MSPKKLTPKEMYRLSVKIEKALEKSAQLQILLNDISKECEQLNIDYPKMLLPMNDNDNDTIVQSVYLSNLGSVVMYVKHKLEKFYLAL